VRLRRQPAAAAAAAAAAAHFLHLRLRLPRLGRQPCEEAISQPEITRHVLEQRLVRVGAW
jgi:hypothetical protein